MKRTNIIALMTALLALVAAIGLPLATAAGSQRATEKVEFDVAEDMNRFIFDKDIVYEDGMPKDGSAFITRGYLYPAGTLTCDDTGCNGVNKDGSPEFPDKVIGEWICQGTMINEAAHATTGVWVFSNQFFQLGTAPGEQTITTTGYELADVGVAINRAITGGTGEYQDARGQSQQQLLGFNTTQGVTLRVTLEPRVR